MSKLHLLLALMFFQASAYAQDKIENLILNGSFESGNTGFTLDLIYQGSEVNPGSYSVVSDPQKVNDFYRTLPDSTDKGNFMVVDVDHRPDINFWCSMVRVEPLSSYRITLSAAHISLTSTYPPEVALFINDNPVGTPAEISLSGWQQHEWKWVSEGNSDTAEVCLQNLTNYSEGSDLAIDDIAMYLVKKPVAPPKVACPYAGDTIQKLVHFGFNEAVLTEYSSQKLQKLLTIAEACPASKIKIIGHADPLGPYDYNMDLSRERTQAIKEYLILNGISEKRLLEEYSGESRILEQHKSIADNVINRRVEFVILED